jgi:hypothetical protein
MLDGVYDPRFPEYFSFCNRQTQCSSCRATRQTPSVLKQFKQLRERLYPFEHDSNYYDSGDQAVEIAGYDIIFQINDAAFLVANDYDHANSYGGSVTFKSFTQN